MELVCARYTTKTSEYQKVCSHLKIIDSLGFVADTVNLCKMATLKNRQINDLHDKW